MLNNYNKLYTELLDRFAELHNSHVRFKEKMNYRNAKKLRLSCVDFEEHVDLVKKRNFSEFKESTGTKYLM